MSKKTKTLLYILIFVVDMKFKNWFSTKQKFSIFFIVIGLLLFSVKPDESFKTLRIIIIIVIALSAIQFWNESIRRYKILVPYKKNKYDSKAEEKIADYFKRKNIIYNHHPEIKVSKPFLTLTIPFVNTKIEPDFFLPEFNVFVEYWGLINDSEYKKNSYDKKKKLYKTNELDFISLYPKNLNNLDFVFTSKLLDLIKERDGNLRKYR